MLCFVVRRRLSPYLDGELAPGRRRAMDHHLTGCPACRTALETVRQGAELAKRGEGGPEPVGLWREFEARIGRLAEESAGGAGRRTSWILDWRRPAWVAAALLLLAGGVLLTARWWGPGKEAASFDVAFYLDQAVPSRDLPAGFLRRLVSAGEASEELGGDLACPQSLPGGFSRSALALLRVRCCRAVAAEYTKGAERLILFQRAATRVPLDFGDRSVRRCDIGDAQGYVLKEGPYQLMNWRVGSWDLTLVSLLEVSDLERLAAAVTAFAERRP